MTDVEAKTNNQNKRRELDEIGARFEQTQTNMQIDRIANRYTHMDSVDRGD